MQTVKATALDKSIQHTNEWLTRLVELSALKDEGQAYSALRAVLHALRDNLIVDEAVHLAAHMPALVRGIYYEGWDPSLAPNKERTPDQFRQHVKSSLLRNQTIDLDEAIRGVFALLDEKIDPGQIEQVRNLVPLDIRNAFWARTMH